MSDSSDPIVQIQMAENEANKKLAKNHSENEKSFAKAKEEHEEELQKLTESLRAEGTEKLNKAKVKASENFKKASEESMLTRESLMRDAEKKKSHAVSIISKTFLDFIK